MKAIPPKTNPLSVPPLIRRFAGESLLVLALLALPQALQAETINVPDNGFVEREILKSPKGKSNRPANTTVQDLQFNTGADASSSVRFPCGMNWLVQGKSRLALNTYQFSGMPSRAEALRVQSGSKTADEMTQGTGSTKGVTTWRAELLSGAVEFASLRPNPVSRQILATAEGEFRLKALSAVVERDAEHGTRIDLVAGEIDVTLKDGTQLTLGAGFRLSVSPSGQVKMERLQRRNWVLISRETEPAAVMPTFIMPERPEDVIFVSVS